MPMLSKCQMPIDMQPSIPPHASFNKPPTFRTTTPTPFIPDDPRSSSLIPHPVLHTQDKTCTCTEYVCERPYLPCLINDLQPRDATPHTAHRNDLERRFLGILRFVSFKAYQPASDRRRKQNSSYQHPCTCFASIVCYCITFLWNFETRCHETE